MSQDGRTPKRAQSIDPTEDAYAVREPEPSAPADRLQGVLPTRKPVVGNEAPPPPLPFMKGVLSFPFYLHTIGATGICGIALSIVFLMVLIALWVAALDPFLTFALRLSIGWPIALSLAYVSVCLLTVIEETSAGYDKILDWPTGDWREWLWSLFTTVGAFIPAAIFAAGIRWLLMVDSPLVTAVVLTAFHPIILLSMLDSGSPLNPWSTSVLSTLVSHWWCWAILYGITGALLSLWVVVFLPLFAAWPWRVAALAGPPLAAILFIYARLLGRIIWRVTRDRNRRD